MASFDIFALPDIGENKKLAVECADVDNWSWSEEHKKGWTKADDAWQQFSKKWRTASNCDGLSNPYLPTFNRPPLEDSTAPEVIFVRNSYLTIFDRIWSCALKTIPNGVKPGILLTGHPGFGKSLSLYYLLIRLLQQNQVVLFTADGVELFLFFGDTVHSASLKAGTKPRLPMAKSPSNIFIWSLFDIKTRTEPESPLLDRRCYPVQSASPDPSRYKIWSKDRRPTIVGFPRWTREELMQGLKCQPYYERFVNVLHKIYSQDPSSQTAVDPEVLLSDYPGAYKILQEYYGVEEESAPTVDDGLEPTPKAHLECTDALKCTAEALTPTPEGALGALLDAAIYHFGYVARDVFQAICNFDAMTMDHETAIAINHSNLKDAIVTLARGEHYHNAKVSNCILIAPTVPSKNPLSPDTWKFDFKSTWVGKNIQKKLMGLEEVEIRQAINLFRQIPTAAALANSFLEHLAHRQLAGTSNTPGDSWSLTKMKLLWADTVDLDNSPTFVADPSCIPYDNQLAKIERRLLNLSITTEFPATFQQNDYYLPSPLDNLLFDAFTVEFDHARNSAILWVLMTSFQSQGDSVLGYQVIRKIVAALKKQILDTPPPRKAQKTGVKHTASGPVVEVRYILVIPRANNDPAQEKKWRPPNGWNENCKINDHGGDVYWLDLIIML